MKTYMRKIRILLILAFASAMALSCSGPATIKSGNLSISVNDSMQFLVSSGYASDLFEDGYVTPDSIFFEEGAAGNFCLSGMKKEKVSDELGKGHKYVISGKGFVGSNKVGKVITVTCYDEFPSTLFLEYEYENLSDDTLSLVKVKTDDIGVMSGNDDPDFWSFQGESTSERNSWILPVSGGFYQRNYMGMNDPDYGGGIPVTCLWRRDAGVSLGHVSKIPQLVSLPVLMKEGGKEAWICMEKNMNEPEKMSKGKVFSTVKSFLHVYKGDCFLPLREFSQLMARRGIVMPESEPDAFEPAWCAWGYERHFTTAEIIATLPKVKELGIKWVTLDDGYQRAEGDWELDRLKFPGGDADMKKLVDTIHSYGLKAQIWWTPLAADPGVDFLREHPDCLMEDKDGHPYKISWWDSYYMSPIDSNVVAETGRLVTKFIKGYGFDGFKLDGQHLNSVHPDYNSAHSPGDPGKANEMLPMFFKMIYDTARSLNPDAVVQLCPCGDCFSFYNMPYVNQFVASDPQSSWQVRSKGYVFRALAPRTAYFGDHIELTDGGDDFGTQLGIGAVLGTKFTYPENDPHVKEDYLLSKGKEKLWKKAFDIYNRVKLSEGEYVPGYYDIGYDKPETHLIGKGDTLYYAFYAKDYSGNLDFRGLAHKTTYRVYDYFNGIDLGTVSDSGHVMNDVKFHGYLLLRLTKVASPHSRLLNFRTGILSVSVNENMRFHFSVRNAVSDATIGYADFDSVWFERGNAGNFVLKKVSRERIDDEFGKGERYSIKGEGDVDGLKIGKNIVLENYKAYPSMVFISLKYTNLSSDSLVLKKVRSNIIHFASKGDDPDFWSFQGESTPERESWILPVSEGFHQRNYMGMNGSGYGGGIPVTCLWRKDVGFAIGHISKSTEMVSLPVLMDDEGKGADMCIEKNFDNFEKLAAGETFSTIPTFLEAYHGDCFLPLRKYAFIMAKRGIVMPASEPEAFEPAWCAWGYGRDFTVGEIIRTLPMVKELGIKWVTVDDGFQTADGDWTLDGEKFPGGDADMKRLVDTIHSYGLKAQIWYKPMVAAAGVPFLEEHPDCLVEDEKGRPYDVTGDGRYCMAPDDNDVIAETKRIVVKFMKDYGFDGIKLDSHHLNSIDPDYNPAHSPMDPEKADRMLPLFYKMIYDTAREVNPHAVIQLCPCGCCFSFYNMPYVNQFVASDPKDSWQVRNRGYVLRALAPHTAYFGDHVELTDGGDDFVSQLGVGAVPGTKFTYPADNPLQKESFLLDAKKEKLWKKAIEIYDKVRLSEGEYVPGYYDIGYDKPETHLISKGDTLYYAFYAKDYSGDLDFRGLEKKARYGAYDYYNDKDMGEIDGSNHVIENVRIHGSLLIRLNKKINR